MAMYDIETILQNCNVNPAEGPQGMEGIWLTELAICQQKKLGRASIEAIHEARAQGVELDEKSQLVMTMRAVHGTLRDWRMHRKKMRMYQRYNLDDNGYSMPEYGTLQWHYRYGYARISEETLNGRNHI